MFGLLTLLAFSLLSRSSEVKDDDGKKTNSSFQVLQYFMTTAGASKGQVSKEEHQVKSKAQIDKGKKDSSKTHLIHPASPGNTDCKSAPEG